MSLRTFLLYNCEISKEFISNRYQVFVQSLDTNLSWSTVESELPWVNILHA